MLITLPTLLDSKSQLKKLLENTLAAKSEIEFQATSDALYSWIDKLHQQLSADHSTFSNLLLEKEGLEIELANTKDWDEEAKRYTLHRLPAGSFVYRSLSSTHEEVSDCFLCANCFIRKSKSILQPRQKSLECHTCNSSIQAEPQSKFRCELI